MANRNAKEWLESVTLDENDLVSDSDTDVATQQSIKAYVDVQSNSMKQLTVTNIVAGDSPYLAAFGDTLYVDSTSTAITIDLPAITSGDYGKRIRICLGRNAVSVTMVANLANADYIYRAASLNTTNDYDTFDLVALPSGAVNNWYSANSN